MSIITCSAMAETTNTNISQDYEKAVEYFDIALQFTTNPNGLKAAIADENVMIIDVRDEESFKKGHVPKAINIPYNAHSSFGDDNEQYTDLVPGKIHYVYCYKHLCNLSKRACKAFAKRKFMVKEVVGGYEEWKNFGGEVVTSPS